ncbi:hypothetical protein J4Q44_G00062180 [Coregonus suidteri]|uniref:Uncharacterized protein n=1 Tax=Coregonus suidteri TaxID=861788 RepID=A0AAN8M6K2_9TELE
MGSRRPSLMDEVIGCLSKEVIKEEGTGGEMAAAGAQNQESRLIRALQRNSRKWGGAAASGAVGEAESVAGPISLDMKKLAHGIACEAEKLEEDRKKVECHNKSEMGQLLTPQYRTQLQRKAQEVQELEADRRILGVLLEGEHSI